VLVKASCHACADITKKFEQDVARELWGDARLSYNAPSRRKKERKTHVILSDPHNPARRVKVPYSAYPAPIVFYKMGRAGLLEGMPESLDASGSWKLEALSDHDKILEFERRFGIKLTAKFRHVPQSFARLIAKIGYGQVLCSLDPSDFRPICLPYILGDKANASFVVGGNWTTAQPDNGMGYVLRTMGFGTPDQIMLLAEVRLFANNSSPTYHVVVGDLTGREKVADAIGKLGDMELALLPAKFVPRKDSDDIHWMPRCWPLPFWNHELR